MQFLKTAFWVVLAMIIMLFTVTNWTPVTINLWSGTQLVTRLPLVVIIAFLAGSLPFWLLHKATRWSLRRKLESAERSLAALLPSSPPPPAPPAAPPPGQPSPQPAANPSETPSSNQGQS